MWPPLRKIEMHGPLIQLAFASLAAWEYKT